MSQWGHEPKGIQRLQLGSDKANFLDDALERVIQQPASAAKGNHANLIVAMKKVFGINLSKYEAVAGAVYALWREGDLAQIMSDDPYIAELKRLCEQDEYWASRADGE